MAIADPPVRQSNMSPDNNIQIDPDRMQCMEIWGGNREIDKGVRAPGVDIYVNSKPYLASQVGGGDIYYVTSCASGRITRLLMADVSGHGESAANLATSLRDLLRANVNTISQEKFIQEMNQEFGRVAEESCFATAVVATYFEPKKSLSLGLAGHPYPIYYRASKRRWVHLDPEESTNRIGNLPLGIDKESSYPGRSVLTQKGDMFLLYSDAFIESMDVEQRQLGISGLVELLNEMNKPEPSEVIPALREKISSLSPGNLEDDDATIMLGHLTATKVRFRDNLAAPFRLMRSVRDMVSLRT